MYSEKKIVNYGTPTIFVKTLLVIDNNAELHQNNKKFHFDCYLESGTQEDRNFFYFKFWIKVFSYTVNGSKVPGCTRIFKSVDSS